MAESTSEKLYLAAKKVNDLNMFGKVKGFSGNEKGYAKIILVKPGCTVWIHHLKNDKLIIDLLVTETAANRYPSEVDWATKRFKEFAGPDLKIDLFEHKVTESDKRERLYIDVTAYTSPRIDIAIDELFSYFGREPF